LLLCWGFCKERTLRPCIAWRRTTTARHAFRYTDADSRTGRDPFRLPNRHASPRESIHPSAPVLVSLFDLPLAALPFFWCVEFRMHAHAHKARGGSEPLGAHTYTRTHTPHRRCPQCTAGRTVLGVLPVFGVAHATVGPRPILFSKMTMTGSETDREYPLNYSELYPAH